MKGFEMRRTGWGGIAGAALAVLLPLACHSQQNSVAGELRDPSTGAAWRLLPGESALGGPARWVLAGRGNLFSQAPAGRRLLIHAGDKIVVEEHTAIMDARLTAIALTSAARGEPLRARISIGGRVVTVRALSAALAELPAERKP